MRQLRVALEPLSRVSARHEHDKGAPRRAIAPRIAVVISTLNEEDSIEAVVRAIPRDLVDRVIVADGQSSDATA